MKIMIHACPQRMWYVDRFLMPELKAQGAGNVIVWNDATGRGNLLACMDAFASCEGDGGVWHLQDDVLPAADFTERAAAHCRDEIVCGFVNELAGPNCNICGHVYAPDMWYSFPCTYIPNRLARECAAWYFGGAWKTEAQSIGYMLSDTGRGDDFFFREFFEIRHGGETALNLKPCLVEHVDWLLGGSVVSPYRGHQSRAVYWDDEERVEDLKRRIRVWKTRRS